MDLPASARGSQSGEVCEVSLSMSGASCHAARGKHAACYPEPMAGKVVAIHRAPAEGAAMEPCASAEIRADFGLVGDRYARPGTDSQLTLVSAEELGRAAASLGLVIPPGATRRNVTIENVILPQQVGARLRLGDVLVEVTGPADPCRLMESCVGPGAREALVGLAGVRARVLEGGVLAIGATVEVDSDSIRPRTS